MKAFGLARIGRDAEVRHTGNGDSVCGLSLAFDRRVKGEKVTDWVDASLWGKRAEALQPYLKKGGLVAVTLDEIHIEEFQSKNGQGHKLAARVIDIELAGGGQATPSQSSQPSREQLRDRQSALSRGEAVEDLDIPF